MLVGDRSNGGGTGTDPEIRSPRALFAHRFAELYEAAGNPTLRRVAAASEARMRAAQGRRGGGVSAQRISDWKAGRNVPARFESLLPVVLTLIDQARASGAPLPQPLADPKEWQRLWRAATTWNPEDEAETSCPYPGLTSYSLANRGLFFGRARATAELVELVRTHPDLIVVVGASGAGKSSLLAAGLVPTLDDWEITTLTPGPHPLTVLREALDTLPTTGTAAAECASNHAASEPVPEPPASDRTTPRHLLVVDQFEEVFTTCASESERQEFLDALADRAGHGTTVVALRADFYAHCLSYPVLQDALEQRGYLLGPMRLDELAQAVTGPARAAGLELEPGLEELVITELCGVGEHDRRRGYDPGALPLLSHVMAATWQHREGRKLTVTGYRKAGGVVGSVAATAEDAWRELSEPQRHAAKDILLGLVTVGQDAHDTRRPARRPELLARAADREDATAALELLSRTRLITLDADAVTLTHEIVLTAWPRLHAWIDEDRVGYLIRQRLESDAAEWAAQHRDSSLLYRGTRLRHALDNADPPPVGDLAREFLTASEVSRAHSRLRTTRTKAALAVLGVVLLVVGFAAYTQMRLADQQRDEKNFAAVLAEADRQFSLDPSLAAQLSLVARQLRPNDAGVGTRLLRTQDLPLVTVSPAADSLLVKQVRYRPGDSALASLDAAGVLRFWDATEQQRPRPTARTIEQVSGFTFSPDGALMLTTAETAPARLWDVDGPGAPREIGVLPDTKGRILAAEFVGDGRTVAILTPYDLELWDVADAALAVRKSVLPLGTGRYGSIQQLLRYGPGSRILATVNLEEGDQLVRLWDTTGSGRAVPVGEFRGATLTVTDLAFDPTGTVIAVGGYDAVPDTGGHTATVRLWDIGDPAHPRALGLPLDIEDDTVNALAFSPDGRTLATAGMEGTVLWNVTAAASPIRYPHRLVSNTTSCRYREVSTPCVDGPTDIVFAPDGRTLATGAVGRIETWSLPPARLDGHAGVVAPPLFDASGDRMVSVSADGRIQVWDMRDGQPPAYRGDSRLDGRDFDAALTPDGRTLLVTSFFPPAGYAIDISDPARIGRPVPWRMPDPLYDLALSRDGKIMASGEGERIRLWDLAERFHPVPFDRAIPSGNNASSMDFSPDGTTLLLQHPPVSVDGDFTIGRWDVSDPARPRYLDDMVRQHAGMSNFASYSPDFQLMATTDSESVQLWDISDLAKPVRIGEPFVAHPLSTRTIDFSADGRTMITSDFRGAIQLWELSDPAHPRRLGEPLVESGQPWLSSLHPSGRFAVATDEDGALRVWDLDIEHAVDRVCAVTGELWTPELWQRYLPQLPYDPPCA
ncbi:Uncharacterized protein containing caspase domain [Nocardia otitidiscaviarum]|uniref:Uncharacterized protein containing caspase domain n=1 Tax=Nocardia otitidiscaviarum TaxID=1823 RepID=A0A378YI74_9NOCA|nr:WD40 repeat domain-containing protein [Nocardia otitidiscaviarum]SUA76896.1 Uncharacterized protein containing caspase domain [Nocardia otitidiscaviarum]